MITLIKRILKGRPLTHVEMDNNLSLIEQAVNSKSDSVHSHDISDINNLEEALEGKLDSAMVGVANGVATLTGEGKIPDEQLPDYVNSGWNFNGTVDITSVPTDLKVGIGTETPQTKLDVEGSFRSLLSGTQLSMFNFNDGSQDIAGIQREINDNEQVLLAVSETAELAALIHVDPVRNLGHVVSTVAGDVYAGITREEAAPSTRQTIIRVSDVPGISALVTDFTDASDDFRRISVDDQAIELRNRRFLPGVDINSVINMQFPGDVPTINIFTDNQSIGETANIVLNDGNILIQGTQGLQLISNRTTMPLPAYDDDAAAGAAGLTPQNLYQTTGAGSAPLNVPGIVMIKQ